jgi:predicted acyltransferase
MPRDPGAAAPASDRLVSLDAYRGFTMLAMASGGLGLKAVADLNERWKPVAHQVEHVDWTGCVFWDLIQPSFMFIVGVSMVFSFAARQGKGQSYPRQFLHAVKRAALLCLIGFFLDSYFARGVQIQFIRVLQQIAIGYLIAFAVLPLGPRVQAVTAIFLLIGHTAAYMLYAPGIPPDAPASAAKVLSAASSLDPSWQPLDNFGRQLDMRLHLPLSTGYYATFNAISSAATILFGVLIGELLRSGASATRKINVLLGAGLLGLAVGWAMSGGGGWTGIELHNYIPMVKKLWTASFAIFAAGWTCLMLLAFYAIIDVAGYKMWAFPFVVVGMNSIAMYVIAQALGSNARQIADVIVPRDDSRLARLSDYLPTIDLSAGRIQFGIELRGWYLTPLISSLIALTLYWLAVYWLYRRKVFFKV